MPKKLKNNISEDFEFEYQGQVRQDLINAAVSGELMNQHYDPEACHFNEFEQKDFQATIDHLEGQGEYGEAKHLRNRLKVITQG